MTRPPRRLARILQTAMTTVLALGAARQSPPAQTPAALPPAREIINRYLAAIGGAAAYKSVTSVRARGQFELVGQSISGALEMITARPNKVLIKVDIPGVGHIENGFNGKIGWSIDPQSGPEIVTGTQLSEQAEDAWFDGPLHASDRVRTLATVDRADFNQHQAYKVHVVYVSGQETFEYFDIDSGLELGWEGQRTMPMGLVPTEAFFRDYKACGPIQQPVTLIERALGAEQRIHVDTCETNVVPGNAFELPPAIKALIK